MIILGIETSCDETAAALLKDADTILSSAVMSQIDIHKEYGGVVPELASRKHIEAISYTVEKSLETAGKGFKDIDAVAATKGPGLIGALLVGFNFAKACAFALGVPFIGVDHLKGHIESIFFQKDPPSFPFTVLLASGGHTNIYYVKSHTSIHLMGQTRDDAAGEAYDKASKMMGLGYPGGMIIDQMAAKGAPDRIRFPRAYLKGGFDFSFSGLKTAVKRYIDSVGPAFKDQIADIAAGFQEAVTDVLVSKLINAALSKDCPHIAVVGGVAANSRLREKIRIRADKKRLKAYFPPIEFCGDNAAMIAAAGYHSFKDGNTDSLDSDVYSRIG